MTKRKPAVKKGYTLIELVLVLFLLIFISMAVFSLTGVGSETFLRLSHTQSIQSDLRIGLSYIDVKLRQNNTADAIMLSKPQFSAEVYKTERVSDQALLINRVIEGIPYELWIYHYDGYLCELLTQQGALIEPDLGTKIVRADAFNLSIIADDALTFSLVLTDNQGLVHQQSRTVTLRTGDISR